MAATKSFTVLALCLLLLSVVRPTMADDQCYDNCVKDGGWGREILCSVECLHPVNPFKPEEPPSSPPSPAPVPEPIFPKPAATMVP